MRKIFAIALVVVMMMSLATTASAVDYVKNTVEDKTGSTKADVYAKYSTDVEEIGVISVDVTFEDMYFIYVQDTDNGVWNPEDHTYDGTAANGVWQAHNGSRTDGHLINVTNHSNVDIWVDIVGAVDEAQTGTGVAMTFQKITDTDGTESLANWAVEKLAAGVVNEYDNAADVDVLTSLTGNLSNSVTDFTDIGDVTVTIYNADPNA